jgi:hypothetical protein
MIPVSQMTVGEFGAFVATHLRSCGIDVILTGGSCVTIYSSSRYTSFDLDFIAGRGATGKKIKAALHYLGFREKNRYFVHPDSGYFVEFPSGPLAVGDEPVGEVVELEYATGRLRLISPTDCVKDRLAGFYHWKDLQCLEQAVLVVADNDVDLDEIERWSKHEGMQAEFGVIKGRLVKHDSV